MFTEEMNTRVYDENILHFVKLKEEVLILHFTTFKNSNFHKILQWINVINGNAASGNM